MIYNHINISKDCIKLQVSEVFFFLTHRVKLNDADEWSSNEPKRFLPHLIGTETKNSSLFPSKV